MPKKQTIVPAAYRSSNVLGGWAFLIGVLLALVVGIGLLPTSISPTITMILVLIGILIGLLNVTKQEVNSFLMSGAVLVIASALGNNELGNIDYIGTTMSALLAIFVPATIVVAIKKVFQLARN